jgi:hypothetical protein
MSTYHNNNRTALASKECNVNTSPTKSKSRSSSSSPFKVSPTKRTKVSPTKYVAKKDEPRALNFTIFEDHIKSTVAEFNDLEVSGKENGNSKPVKSVSFNEQENILQPKFKTIPQHNLMVRKPLQDLSIQDFKGFLYTNDSTEQLCEQFVPKTYKNESNTIHKFHNYPSYVSPMKSNTKYLFKSPASSSLSDEINEEDELEESLMRKLITIKNNRLHKRSFSLGKNDLKHSLIRKNGFTILSN